MESRVGIKNSTLRILLLTLALALLSGCDSGFQTMGPSEHGAVFNALPTWRAIPESVRGGVRKKLLEPGETEFIFPWQQLYRIDTSVQSIGLGWSRAR